MAFTDNRTTHFNLPLPNSANQLETDVVRIVEALSGLDTAIYDVAQLIPDDLEQTLSGLQTSISGLSELSGAITALQDARGAANGLATLGASSTLTASQVPNLAADKVTTGTFVAARIPELPAGQITSGTFAAERIPALDAGKVTSGSFDAARIPVLSADKLTTGTLPVARGGSGLGTVTVGSFLRGNGTGAMVERTGAQVLGDIGAMPAAGGTMTGSLSVTGDIVASGNVTGYSDRRLKTDIAPIVGALEKVSRLQGVTYEMVADGRRGTGLVAQDVLAVLPEAVGEVDGLYTVAYGNLAGLLVAALQELHSQVSDLRQAFA